MALILRYFTEFRSFRGALRKTGWRCRRKKREQWHRRTDVRHACRYARSASVVCCLQCKCMARHVVRWTCRRESNAQNNVQPLGHCLTVARCSSIVSLSIRNRRARSWSRACLSVGLYYRPTLLVLHAEDDDRMHLWLILTARSPSL